MTLEEISINILIMQKVRNRFIIFRMIPINLILFVLRFDHSRMSGRAEYKQQSRTNILRRIFDTLSAAELLILFNLAMGGSLQNHGLNQSCVFCPICKKNRNREEEKPVTAEWRSSRLRIIIEKHHCREKVTNEREKTDYFGERWVNTVW